MESSNHYRIIFISLILSLGGISLHCQNTLGLITYEPWMGSYNGYNLIYPHNQPHVYLLDNCGRIINQWDDVEGYKPGNTAYITTDGHLIKTKRKSSESFGYIYDTTGEAYVECRDWDNNLLWQFSYVTDSGRLHHDIEVTPQGTILMIAWDHYSVEEAILKGRLPIYMEQDAFSPDKIMEYDPAVDSIIWEWKAWDHLVQDIDPARPDYGVISDNFRRININYENNFNRADWMHVNSIDYHPGRDHIMINVPTFNEIWIIDHSTTTEEAAGSSGGKSGHGGDLLWRWGNPAAYNKGTLDDQKLYFQHDALWALDYLETDDPNLNQISIFNNKWTSSESSVGTISITYDTITHNYPRQEGKFLPNDFSYHWTHPEPSKMYSTNMSSMQILPNGNHLICAGRQGYSFEYDPMLERIVWEYITPLRNGFIASQNDNLNIGENPTFRIRRYPLEYSGFEGKDLAPKDYLEMNPDLNFCDQLLSDSNPADSRFAIYPNPSNNLIHISSDHDLKSISIIDIQGKLLIRKSDEIVGGQDINLVDISNLTAGMYIIILNDIYFHKLIVE